MYRQQQWRQVTEVELCLVVAHPQASEDSLHDNIIQKNGNNLNCRKRTFALMIGYHVDSRSSTTATAAGNLGKISIIDSSCCFCLLSTTATL